MVVISKAVVGLGHIRGIQKTHILGPRQLTGFETASLTFQQSALTTMCQYIRHCPKLPSVISLSLSHCTLYFICTTKKRGFRAPGKFLQPLKQNLSQNSASFLENNQVLQKSKWILTSFLFSRCYSCLFPSNIMVITLGVSAMIWCILPFHPVHATIQCTHCKWNPLIWGIRKNWVSLHFTLRIFVLKQRLVFCMPR